MTIINRYRQITVFVIFGVYFRLKEHPSQKNLIPRLLLFFKKFIDLDVFTLDEGLLSLMIDQAYFSDGGFF